MASYNRIVLMGNLTRDPELSYTPNNTAVCKFGLATNRKWRDSDGRDREEVCFVDCKAFARRGEVINQYMAKGRSILVEGRLHWSQWTTQEGEKRSKHEVVVDNFTFVGSPSGGPPGGAGQSGGAAASVPADAAPAYDAPSGPPSGDRIPF